MKKILHLTSAKVDQKKWELLGSSKDIFTRTEYFNDRNIEVKKISNYFPMWEEAINKINEKEFSHVLIEHCPPVKIQYKIYKKFGKTIYRSHNAEALHRYDIFKFNLKLFFKGILFENRKLNFMIFIKIIYRTFFYLPSNIFKYFFRDLITSFFSSNVISISQWDKENYWSYFASNKCLTAPFFLPKNYMSKINQKNKKNIIIISGSILPNSISYDQVLMIKELYAIKEHKIFKEFKFIVTGNISRGVYLYLIKKKIHTIKNLFFYTENFTNNDLIQKFNNISNTSFKNFYDILSISKAMLFLSSGGYGFKTKAAEAYSHNNKLIVPDNLYKKFPRELNKITYRFGNIKELNKILLDLYYKKEFNNNINDALKKIAYTTYDKIFNI